MDDVDDLLREVRRMRDQLPQWCDELERLEGTGEAANGRVRATCRASGDIDRVDIDTRFLRNAARSGEVDAALLRALQAAQAAASRMVSLHQEQLRILELPLANVLSGKQRFSDLFPSRTARHGEHR